tara:strand:- start:39 stop:953 length:915 start_codon:yes stop_codon:yes gene_type:complete
MGLDVSALSDFNNEVAGELIAKMVYGGSTMEYITIKEGVKFQEPINLMEVDLVLQNGTCVSTPSGSLDFSQRNITVCPRTSFDGICLKDMDRTYLGISALERGSYNETFALATNYSELLVNQMQKKNDQFLWTALSGSAPAGCSSDGLVKIISGSTTGVVAAGTGDATLANLEVMLAALSPDVADRDDLTYFMSVSKFRALIGDIRTQNNFYFDPVSVSNRGGILEIGMPFQNAKIIGTVGLQGSARIVLGPAKQIVAGTDLMSDFSEFQLWYDINSDQLKHRISTKLGVNIAYGEFWVSNDEA